MEIPLPVARTLGTAIRRTTCLHALLRLSHRQRSSSPLSVGRTAFLPESSLACLQWQAPSVGILPTSRKFLSLWRLRSLQSLRHHPSSIPVQSRNHAITPVSTLAQSPPPTPRRLRVWDAFKRKQTRSWRPTHRKTITNLLKSTWTRRSANRVTRCSIRPSRPKRYWFTNLQLLRSN